MDKRILVVDDEELLRQMMARFFKRKGFEAFEAHSGNSALELLRNQPVDIIVSDVRMSDGDGKFLLESVRKEFDPAPPVILISGFADADMEELQQLGAASIQAKPIDKKNLLESINKILA